MGEIIQDMGIPVRVILRLRPESKDELKSNAKGVRIAIQGATAYLTVDETVKEFTFDEIIDLEDDDEDAFDENDEMEEDEEEDNNTKFSAVTLAEQIVESLLDGKIAIHPESSQPCLTPFVGSNNCILAYGLRKSGKSFSLFGSSEEANGFMEFGLLQNVGNFFFQAQARHMELQISAFGIYREKQFDLFDPIISGDCAALKGPTHHPLTGCVAPDWVAIPIDSEKTLTGALQLLQQGISHWRIVNDAVQSSSTILVRYTFTRKEQGQTYTSYCDFVDLPAHIQVQRTLLSQSEESKLLTQSTRWFDSFLKSLVPQPKSQPECIVSKPSCLETWLTSPLSGNYVTTLLVSTPPVTRAVEDLADVLRRAQLARRILTFPEEEYHSNEYIVSDIETSMHSIRQEALEIENGTLSIVTRVSTFKKNQMIADHQNKTQKEKERTLAHADELLPLLGIFKKTIRDTSLSAIQAKWNTLFSSLGSSVVIDASTSFALRRLHEDGIVSQQFYYNMSRGETSAGKCIPQKEDIDDVDDVEDVQVKHEHGIILFGPGALEHHCIFRFDSSTHRLEMIPSSASTCFKNGVRLIEHVPYPLMHRDVILMGARNAFQVQMPTGYGSTTSPELASYQEGLFQLFHPECIESNMIHHAKSTCKSAYEELCERIMSIKTLHEQVPDAMDGECTYDLELQAPIISMDIANIKNRKASMRMPKAREMSSRHRRVSIKKYSTIMQTEMNHFEQFLNYDMILQLFQNIVEANAMAYDLGKDMKFSLSPAIDHAVIRSAESGVELDKVETKLWVRVEHLSDLSHPAMWSIHDMENRVGTMREYWKKNIQKITEEVENTSPKKVKNNGPFSSDSSDQLLGKATIFLGALNYLLPVQDIIQIIDEMGNINGEIVLQIIPCLQDEDTGEDTGPATFTPYTQDNIDMEEEQLQDYMGRKLQLRVHLQGIRGLPHDRNSNVFMRYKFYVEDSYFSTPRSAVKSVHPLFNCTLRHNCVIQDDLILYIVNDHLEIEVFGSRGSHVPGSIQTILDGEEEYWVDCETRNVHELVDTLHRELKLAKECDSNNEPLGGEVSAINPVRHHPFLRAESKQRSLAFLDKKDLIHVPRNQYDSLLEELETAKKERGKAEDKLAVLKAQRDVAAEKGAAEKDVAPVAAQSAACLIQ